jgi:Mlc titration factor MtfA (ptsG expression regulator)
MEFLELFARVVYSIVQRVYYTFWIRPRVMQILGRYSTYYKNLRVERAAFERRVWNFIGENNFIAREGVKATFKLKAIIAAHAAQLAFRLPEESYDYYERIILYKDYYLSRITGQYHKAEVNPGMRLIVFSVRAIQESFKKHTAGVNVLLHEFAHALWLEHKLMHHQYQIFNPDVFKEVEERILVEFERLRENEHHFFRKYAFANQAEFFAVAIENFFESPGEFKHELPELYQMLTRLMRQDPLHIVG